MQSVSAENAWIRKCTGLIAKYKPHLHAQEIFSRSDQQSFALFSTILFHRESEVPGTMKPLWKAKPVLPVLEDL
jgi:hypothetical protein